MELKVNNYTVLASLRRWEEWTTQKNDNGDIIIYQLANEQDDVSGEKIEEWTFTGVNSETGEEYYTDDKTFPSFYKLEKYLNSLPRGEDA